MTRQATGRQADPVRPLQLSIGQITAAAQQLLLPKNPILPDSPFYQQKSLHGFTRVRTDGTLLKRFVVHSQE